MTTSSVLITPALGLKFMTDSGLKDFAMQRIHSITENIASFPGLSPTPAELQVIADDYAEALSKCGANGTPTDTNNKNICRVQLEKALTLCALSCAGIADNLAIYLLSGFSYKSKGKRINELETPLNLQCKQAPLEGSVYILFKSVKNACAYEVRIGKESNPDNWTDYNIDSGSPVLMTDLKPMSIYYVRLRAIGARNIKSVWTQVLQVKVM